MGELQPHNAEDRRLKDAKNDEVLSVLRALLPAVTALLMINTLFHLVVERAEVGPGVFGLNLLVAGGCYWLHLWVRHASFPREWADPVAAGTIVVLTMNSLAHLFAASAWYQVIAVAALMVGAAHTLLSVRWFVFVEVFSLSGFVLAAAHISPPAVWVPLTVGLSVMALNCIPFLRSRLRTFQDEDKKRQSAARSQLEALEREQEKRKKEERDRLAIEAANDGHWYWDLDTDKIHFSRQWAFMLGYEEQELGNDPDEWFKRVHPYYLPELKESLSAHIYGKTEQFQHQYRVQHRDGTYLWVLSRGLALRDDSGNPVAMAGSQIDVTHLMEVEKSIVNDAFHDKLTGLANKRACLIRLESAVDRLKKSGAYLFAVLFLDLDRFKVINDSLGHLVGDQLLAAVAARVRGCIRKRTGDMIARFGGDEFVILMEDLRSTDEATEVAKRIQEVLVQPFKLGKHEVKTGTSIGIAFSTTQIQRAEDLLRYADTAMYHAKGQGKGRIQVFNTEMHSEALRICRLETDLSKALDRNQLLLHYQPLVSLQSGGIIGAEALLRWNHTLGGLIGPSEFIPIAEESGLIERVGEWALRAACSQSAAWQQAGLSAGKIAVNISAYQLRRENFPQSVVEIVSETGLDPKWLELELTETTLMDNLDAATEAMNRLSEAGIRISIDDFGTGYSSLGYLKRFPFDSLKMDRSFVGNMTKDEKSAAVAKGLIHLAHNLNLKVTAEGVETEEQLAFLRSEKCDQMQGYLASRPLDTESFSRLLASDFNLFRHLGGARQHRPSQVLTELRPT